MALAHISLKPRFAVHVAESYTTEVQETREDAEELPELPPLVENDDTDPEGDLSDLLHSFEGDADLDDTAAEDLDAGLELEDDGPTLVDDVERPLDIGEVVQARDDEGSWASDEFGPAGDTPGQFDDTPALELDSDDAEGTLEPEEPIPEDLPGLIVQEGDEQEGGLSEESDELLGMGEEEPPRRAERPWLESPPIALANCRVVRCGNGVVAAGAMGVVSIAADGEVQTVAAALGDTVKGIYLDPDSAALLALTERGKLFRLVGNGAPPEELTAFRAVHSLDRDTPLSLSLGGPTQSSRPAALLHAPAGGGVLVESTDRGTTWRSVDLGGRVLALSVGVPPVCVVEGQDGAWLFRSEASGAFRRVGAELIVDEQVELVSSADVVAILEPGFGVRVSADGGTTIRRVIGCARATAVTAGRLGGRPSAFAALFDAASGHTSLVWIDAATADAHVVSELLPDAEQDDDLDDSSKVVSLAWDAEDETLWAAGVFGVRRWRRPPSA